MVALCGCPCRLSNGQSIQMVTALILQLVQCIVVPPRLEDRQERGGAQGSAPSSRPDTPTGSESGEDTKKVQYFNIPVHVHVHVRMYYTVIYYGTY